nr:DUF2235 domain-containing protein [Frigidibacter sp. ROC022]
MRRGPRAETAQPARRQRGHVDHVVILDGTLSSLEEGEETNAGLTYKLLRDQTAHGAMIVRYEAGIQWRDWKATLDVVEGRGINRQIRRVYGHLASRYHDGDRIWLFGYSRGAYAARALAGLIDTVGLLRADAATERNITLAYRHYRADPGGYSARLFARANCHAVADIEMIGVWDTVKALGIRAPLFWRWSTVEHQFHTLGLGPSVRRGYHALALDETRDAFAPVMWVCDPDWTGEMIQMWFRGAHGDIGGQLGGFDAARPLANIPLVWMLERAEAAGLPLPQGWRARFPCDATAPSVGTMRGWGKAFLRRHRREVGADPSEQIHPSARGHPVLLFG